jgi:hypothetical protein
MKRIGLVIGLLVGACSGDDGGAISTDPHDLAMCVHNAWAQQLGSAYDPTMKQCEQGCADLANQTDTTSVPTSKCYVDTNEPWLPGRVAGEKTCEGYNDMTWFRDPSGAHDPTGDPVRGCCMTDHGVPVRFVECKP